MFSVLALATAIHATNPRINNETALMYATWTEEAAHQSGIDPWVFHGIIQHETKWVASGVRREHDGTCSVGLGQINVRRCNSVKAKILLNPQYNLMLMGEFLFHAKNICKRNCGNNNWLRAYNPGDHGYVRMVNRSISRCNQMFSKKNVELVGCDNSCSPQVYNSVACLKPEFFSHI